VSLSKPITYITKEYKFPKPTSFIKAFIGEEDALSNKKLDKGIYNIKAPNFKQDIGYIAIENNISNIDILFTKLFNIAKAFKLRNYILIIYNSNVKSDKPINIYIARGNKDITSKLEFIYNNRDIKTLYYKTLKAEGYRVKILKKRST